MSTCSCFSFALFLIWLLFAVHFNANPPTLSYRIPEQLTYPVLNIIFNIINQKLIQILLKYDFQAAEFRKHFLSAAHDAFCLFACLFV